MREISKRKLDEKYEKQIEFEQRLRNINTTNLLKERKNRELLDRRAYYKNIWDEQCVSIFTCYLLLRTNFEYFDYLTPFQFVFLEREKTEIRKRKIRRYTKIGKITE